MGAIELFLTLVSGVAWTIVYICCIRIGFKEKTYCMPLFALGLNFAWEFLYSVDGLGDFSAQSVANIVWCLCDAFIVYTFFKFGKRDFPERVQRHFAAYGVAAFAGCAIFQVAFFLQFHGGPVAGQYSAFLQNAIMSVLFVTMLYRRNSTRGQSQVIAVSKWLGTLAPTILMGVVEGFNIYIVLFGAICCVVDLFYIYELHRVGQQEKQGELQAA